MLFPQQRWPEDTEQTAQLQTGGSLDVTENVKTDIWENSEKKRLTSLPL